MSYKKQAKVEDDVGTVLKQQSHVVVHIFQFTVIISIKPYFAVCSSIAFGILL